jgi:hypothetical protein
MGKFLEIESGNPLKQAITSAASVIKHHIFFEIHSGYGCGTVGSVYVPPTIVKRISWGDTLPSLYMTFMVIKKENMSLSFSNRDLQILS